MKQFSSDTTIILIMVAIATLMFLLISAFSAPVKSGAYVQLDKTPAQAHCESYYDITCTKGGKPVDTVHYYIK